MNEMSDGVRYLYVFAIVCILYAVGLVGAMFTGYWGFTFAHALAILPLWLLAGVFWGQADRLQKKEHASRSTKQ